VRPVPSASVDKDVADGLLAFAESLWLLAKAGFPVVKDPTCTTTLTTNGSFTNEETPSCGGHHAPARHCRDDTYSCRYVHPRSAAVRCVDTCRDGLRCRRRYLLAPKQFNMYKRRLGQHRWRLQRLPP
jgi:hypothetical protein